MKKIIHIALIAAAAGLSGCFSFDTAVSVRTNEEHIHVENYGWRLFNCIPLTCGNATDPASGSHYGPWAFFRDDVTMDKLQRRMTDYAAMHSGKTLTDLTYHNYDTIFVSIPFTSIPIPVPYVVCYREIQLSGVLK